MPDHGVDDYCVLASGPGRGRTVGRERVVYVGSNDDEFAPGFVDAALGRELLASDRQHVAVREQLLFGCGLIDLHRARRDEVGLDEDAAQQEAARKG